MTRWVVAIIVLAALALGCSDGREVKEEVNTEFISVDTTVAPTPGDSVAVSP